MLFPPPTTVRLEKSDRGLIRDELVPQGLVHRELAERAGCGIDTLRKFLYGHRPGPLWFPDEVARALGFVSFEAMRDAARAAEVAP